MEFELQEYKNLAKEPRWLFADKTQKKKDIDSKSGSGTCVGSLINGPTRGAAKLVDLVIVQAASDLAILMFALSLIIQDVLEKNLQGKAVINFPRNSMYIQLLEKILYHSKQWTNTTDSSKHTRLHPQKIQAVLRGSDRNGCSYRHKCRQ